VFHEECKELNQDKTQVQNGIKGNLKQDQAKEAYEGGEKEKPKDINNTA
jgi:hypothetical protein